MARRSSGLRRTRSPGSGIAFCPEERGIFASLDVEENLLLPPMVRQRRHVAGPRSSSCFPICKERLDSQGTKLSGGEPGLKEGRRAGLYRLRGRDVARAIRRHSARKRLVKVKVDENLGRREAERLRAAGHDVLTVIDQNMASATDRQLIEVCRKEERCLVSLDLDFANPLLFKPSDYAGTAVLRLPSRPTADDLPALIDTLAAKLATASITGRLWIVERDRIRQYQPEDL